MVESGFFIDIGPLNVFVAKTVRTQIVSKLYLMSDCVDDTVRNQI